MAPIEYDIINLINEGATVDVRFDGATLPVPLSDLTKLQAKPEPDPIQVFDFAKLDVYDGQDPATKGKGLIDSFRAWGIRTIEPNGDEGFKKKFSGVTHVQHSEGLELQCDLDHRDRSPTDFLAGMVSFEDIMAVQYGAFELDFVLNSIDQGQHVATWLLAADKVWPPEIDPFEFWNTDSIAHYGAIFAPGQPGHDRPGVSQHFPIPGDQHTSRLEWTPDRLEWFMDGVSVHRMDEHNAHEPMFWLASWEVNSKTGPVSVDTKWPGNLLLKELRYKPLA